MGDAQRDALDGIVRYVGKGHNGSDCGITVCGWCHVKELAVRGGLGLPIERQEPRREQGAHPR